MSREKDPARAYRPFDAKANGYVPGEGGAILIVEEFEYAKKRGAPHVYAEMLGYCATQDVYHHAKRAPDSRPYARAMRKAIHNAGISPQELDFIFADRAGDLVADPLQAHAIR